MSEQHWLDRKLFNSSYDRELMWVVLLLIVFGMVMIYSASVDGRLYKTGNQYYYLFRQGLFFLISFFFLIQRTFSRSFRDYIFF